MFEMRTFKILLCDDDDWDRVRHPEHLKKCWGEMFAEGLDVHGCSDIVETDPPPEPRVALGKVGQYDALLLDIWWGKAEAGERHGIEIARQVRRRYPDLPIMVFSGQVTVRDFEDLIPLRIAGYLTKNAIDASSWCAEIHRVLEQVGIERAGQPLFQLLRRLLCETDEVWCGEQVGEAASEVWRSDNVYQKWSRFWARWIAYLGEKRVAVPCTELAQFFRQKELLMLSVHQGFRGHLEHVLHVYFTGYVLSHRIPHFRDYVFFAVRDLLGAAYQKEQEDYYWDMFQVCWLLVATLHDLAYPLEMLSDVVKEAERVQSLFPFARFSHAIEGIEAKEIDWSTGEGRVARGAFRFVLSRLYSDEANAEFVESNAVYKDHGTVRFNHGVASGARFMAEASKWATDENPPVIEFYRWVSTAMALHSLKYAGQTSNLRLSLERDPLSFLLSLCDELQVWNRSRPDETPTSSDFRRVELIAMDLTDNVLTATLQYDLWPDIDRDRRDDVLRRTTARINKDELLLKNYLKAAPLQVVICNEIREPPEKLPSIILK
jgi:CheY-like chemotaxis protein